MLVALPCAAQDNVQVSLAVERIGGVSAVTVSPDDADDDLKLNIIGLGGPLQNPAAAPRIGADYVIEAGLTLGGAVGGMSGAAEVDGDKLGSASFFLLQPRIGYRIAADDIFDITPRIGATMLWGSFQTGEGERCSYNYDTGNYDCQTVDGDDLSGSATMLSLEVVGALRATDSFNLLAGLAYDHLVSASGEIEQHEFDGGTDTESDDYDGGASSLQLWFGLGGYL